MQKLPFYYLLCSVGALWSFVTTTSPHIFQNECHPFMAKISNNHERLNGLFDDAINDIAHHVQAYITSNESYTYKQMLKEDDYRDFFKAMLDEIEVHEKRDH